MPKTKSPKVKLPDGIYVVKVDSVGGGKKSYLAFDLVNLPTPRSVCVGRLRGVDDTCLVYFHKEPPDPPYPKMVAWGATSSTNIVKNPTLKVIEELLREENEYRKARDAYIGGFEGKLSNALETARSQRAVPTINIIKKLEGLIFLNRGINSLYGQYFPSEVPVSELSFLPPVEMPADEEIYMETVAVPPGPRLFSGLLDAASSKKTRKLRRDINKLRRTIARSRLPRLSGLRVGYRKPLTAVDEWNISKDKEGLSDTSSDEDGFGYKQRRKKKKKKKKKTIKRKNNEKT